MTTPDVRRRKKHHGKQLRLTAAIAAAAALCSLPAAPAEAGDGGTSTSGSGARTGKATLVNGKAIPPSDAPQRVVDVIAAANHIRRKPYKWGGGHGSWNDSGYDCSGSVSYALHGGRFLRHPLASGGLMHWRQPRKGSWITVFANPGHAFMVVAGLRFDTSMVRGSGPGWSKDIHAENWRDFRKRHPRRY